ncbi:hypothetical protein FE257_011754 [Aspergillus nanangensis]|uniref:Transcription factor domain-containing protein n=1 Tax=Aspergillus nanangensis TaxID=2582783 RepID=A0AAD4GXU9_ASPNN|nr:hypothetical protein FE257_011754 [Aspergillus nanangensis]
MTRRPLTGRLRAMKRWSSLQNHHKFDASCPEAAPFLVRDVDEWDMTASWTQHSSGKIEALEKEIQHLRSSVTTSPVVGGSSFDGILISDGALNTDTSLTVSHYPSGVEQVPVPLDFSQQGMQQCSTPPSLRQSQCRNAASKSASSTTERTIDSIQLSGIQIDKLFHIFFKHYHPYVSLLDPTISGDAYYARSPLLFWVIILVASRQYTEEPSLLVSLTHTMSTRLGLHRPDSIQDFSRTKRRLGHEEVAEAARIWAACFSAMQSLVPSEGQVGILSDWMVDQLCDRDGFGIIPIGLKHQLLLYRFAAKVCQFLSSNPSTPTGLPKQGEGISLLALLDREFSEMTSSLSRQLSGSNQVILHGVALQLYVFYLLDDSESNSRKRGLIRAYVSASEVISLLNALETSSQVMEHGPIQYFRILSMAALFILKLTYSNLSVLIDTDSGKRAFNLAVSLIRRASISDNDIQDRMSMILTQLWSVQSRNGQCDQKPGLKLRTRLSSSLIHDSLWAWREQFSGQQSLRVPGPSSTDISDDISPGEPTFGGLTLENVIDSEILSLLPFTLNGADL